jgi:hypothetical protein
MIEEQSSVLAEVCIRLLTDGEIYIERSGDLDALYDQLQDKVKNGILIDDQVRSLRH